MHTKKKPFFLSFLLISIIVFSCVQLTQAKTDDYIIYFNSPNYTAKDKDGTIISTNADFPTVFQAVYDIIKPYETLHILGDLTIDSTIAISKTFTLIVDNATITTDNPIIKLYDLSIFNLEADYLNVYDDVLSNDTALLLIQNTRYVTANVKYINNYGETSQGKGVMLYAGESEGVMTTYLCFNVIDHLANAITFYATSDGWINENRILRLASGIDYNPINITNVGTGQIWGNEFNNCLIEGAEIGISLTGDIQNTVFRSTRLWDWQPNTYTYYANSEVKSTLFIDTMLLTNGTRYPNYFNDSGTNTTIIADWRPYDNYYYSTSDFASATTTDDTLLLGGGIGGIIAIVILVFALRRLRF